MNTVPFFITALLAAASLLTSHSALAQDEDDEEAADLKSYSVGSSRPTINPGGMKIERPKIDTSFKLDIKPAISDIKIARPTLQVVPPPEAASADASDGTRTATAPADESGAVGSTYPPGGETRSVVPLQMDAPQYPRDAWRLRQEGYVVVEFTITAAGGTDDIAIVEAQPRGAFEQAARRAVAGWTFKPALQNGRPVPQRIRHTLEFKLNGR